MSLDLWLNKTILEENVHGVLIIDEKTGLSLGSRGVAENIDAQKIKWLRDHNQHNEIFTLRHNDSIVYVTQEGDILLAIYKPASQRALSSTGSTPSLNDA
ncbi:uncharacterized protein SAPINGB_P004895 [Magnusiomyces paraingens]|uniref:Late endosomal/lysosomal adaptor and MAPK and MTOR activator 5 n=1 Tax=Magnusiomyces paraingens TaxID=2606893 RepID=A0A5E8C015_9ASCO|nr:uncharacterized protein SAPINGB_P004895 [Saprochaete ingens]VVT56210.1 unnamed protein product [Saprochaete ingens]